MTVTDAPVLTPGRAVRPPVWLMVATGVLAVGGVALAVAETNLWMHYVIDAGESISLVGLAFILAAGLHLYSRRRLTASLPLALPWLLFPVITQGDQLIDNLSINWMRLIVHVLLGALFAMPVAVVVLALPHVAGRQAAQRGPAAWYWHLLPGLALIRRGRLREGSGVVAAVLFVAEMWVAVRYLGELMVITLILMVLASLAYAFAGTEDTASPHPAARRSERTALVLLCAGVALSAGLFFGFKNRPGAYQGSPSHFMDPAQGGAAFDLARVPVPSRPVSPPPSAEAVRTALTAYGRAFQELLAGYYILDRNYNYDFHNRLFLRSTPLLANYRAAGLQRIQQGDAARLMADRGLAALPPIPVEEPTGALLADVRAYAAYSFERARLLERMSAGFEQTQAGLQHATHIYEGEGKFLGVQLAAVTGKHQRVLASPQMAAVTSEFTAMSRAVQDAYANRIVGF